MQPSTSNGYKAVLKILELRYKQTGGCGLELVTIRGVLVTPPETDNILYIPFSIMVPCHSWSENCDPYKDFEKISVSLLFFVSVLDLHCNLNLSPVCYLVYSLIHAIKSTASTVSCISTSL